MTDRPILFSAPMVRALLDGRKTQTRRVLSGVPEWCGTDRKPGYSCLTPPGHIEFRGHYPGDAEVEAGFGSKFIKLRFQKGDRLYVREAWRAARSLDQVKPRDIPRDADIEHEATARSYAEIGLTGRQRPGIHMPRWASRLTLLVTEVRVERLQDCSEADAIAEGIVEYEPTNEDPAEFAYVDGGDIWNNARSAYQALWNSINGPGAWDANPWVVAITFTVEKRNIDQ